MKPFELYEGYEDGTYMIVFIHDTFMGGYNGGSYSIIGARVLGLSYANYLRYMRDTYGAEVRGREGYSYLIFKDQGKCLMAVQELNKYWAEIENALKPYCSELPNKKCDVMVSERATINGKPREIRRIKC